jgi:hypothetical protein
MHCCRARLINFLIFQEKIGRLNSGCLVLHFAILGHRRCNNAKTIESIDKKIIRLRTVAECNEKDIQRGTDRK